MTDQEWRRHAEDLALARYAVIAPLVTRKLTHGEYRLTGHPQRPDWMCNIG